MKLRSLGSVVLATTILFGAAGQVHGVSTSLESDGTITYQEDNTANPVVDPENPSKEIDSGGEIVKNPDTGPLTVDAVTKLSFMTQNAVTTDQTYFAKQISVTEKGTAVGTRGNFVQVTDKRLSTRDAWTLNAKMTQQFQASATDVLTGAKIVYSNPYISGSGATAIAPVLKSGNSFTIEPSVSVPVMGAEDNTKGFGTWTIEFGTSAGVNGAATDTTGAPDATNPNLIKDGSVQLFVPGNIAKTANAYTAKIEWALTTAP